MKNRLLTCAILIILFTPALAAGQDLSDFCHVYVIDLKIGKQVAKKYPTSNEQEDARLLASAISIVGRFSPETGEEVLTNRTYQLPGTDQIITVSVVYTDEHMFSTRLKTPESMLVGIVVSKKAKDSAFEAKNNAVAETTYTEYTDTIRVTTQAHTQGRRLIVGLECRCDREFDETDPNRQTKKGEWQMPNRLVGMRDRKNWK
ncbi:MAG: hypothetical protein MOB07_08210 [Acidobacteria bacterium]|nr:hypothetical protein [Acidobacteriota bacterium]